MNKPRQIELLSPARDTATAIEAIRHGADAIYIGASSHGARAAAANSVEDIAGLVEYAHRFGVRIYVTLNTIIYPEELKQVESLIHDLYRIGVDALIVQDMSLLRMELPPIALHASTQCDVSSAEKARFLADAGFSQIVLARELTLDETSEIHRLLPDTALEAFVHGALCVSYSGNCHAGIATMGRSANRGECPQICRLPFDLTDSEGNVLVRNRHLLSLRDLNRSRHIAEMMDAGVSSFKIEGRLKDIGYVKNVTASYRAIIDRIIEANPDKYCRSSFGDSEIRFTPDLSESFNRGFTDYFTCAPRPESKMASILSPKWCGNKVGTVIQCSRGAIKASLTATLNNGDGLGYFDRATGEFRGFRLNRIDGNMLYPASAVQIPVGTAIYRNHNKARADIMNTDTASRTISVNMTLRADDRMIAIDASDCRGCRITVSEFMDLEQASTPQQQRRIETLRKTGGTIYRADRIEDNAGTYFIPAKTLTALRRRALEALDSAWKCRYKFDQRRAENKEAMLWEPSGELTYHNNVANPLAAEFYRSHGAAEIEPALEVARKNSPDAPLRIMTTRYCLRRELGACLRNPKQASHLPRNLYLNSGNLKFALAFDCARCRMYVDLVKNKGTV